MRRNKQTCCRRSRKGRVWVLRSKEMADKASKAVVLYGDGLARFIDSSHTHLHALVSKGCSGFLSLPNVPPSETEDDRMIREFAVLLDSHQAYLDQIEEPTTQAESQKTSLSDRFMGMRAALITNNSKLKSFGGKLGFTTLQLNELTETDDALSRDVVASGLLKLLGFKGGKIVEASQFDLVFVHVGSGEKDDAFANDMEYVNALVGAILQIAQPGSEVGLRLHLSVVLSYGCVVEADKSNLSILIPKDDLNSDLLKLVPRQSYLMKGEYARDDVRHHCPMLISQWQYAVTRKDMAETFSFKDFKERGGNLVIPADRFLHEVAFKLWKAPKYGA